MNKIHSRKDTTMKDEEILEIETEKLEKLVEVYKKLKAEFDEHSVKMHQILLENATMQKRLNELAVLQIDGKKQFIEGMKNLEKDGTNLNTNRFAVDQSKKTSAEFDGDWTAKMGDVIAEINAKLLEGVAIAGDSHMGISSNYKEDELEVKNEEEKNLIHRTIDAESKKTFDVVLKEAVPKRKKTIDVKNSQIVGMMKDKIWKKSDINERANFFVPIDGGISMAKFDSNSYKFNEMNSAPGVVISEEGLVAMHRGAFNSPKCIRACSPIPMIIKENKSILVFYFEMEIIKKTTHRNNVDGIYIGFCTQAFELDKHLGKVNDSIGIHRKNELLIDGKKIEFKNGCKEGFNEGESIGLGIFQHQRKSLPECFVTCNEKLLGKAELPSKFATLELFPAFNLIWASETIRAKFAREEWCFKEFKKLLQ